MKWRFKFDTRGIYLFLVIIAVEILKELLLPELAGVGSSLTVGILSNVIAIAAFGYAYKSTQKKLLKKKEIMNIAYTAVVAYALVLVLFFAVAGFQGALLAPQAVDILVLVLLVIILLVIQYFIIYAVLLFINTKGDVHGKKKKKR